MSTVDKAFADRIVALNGKYMGDPQIEQIIEYDNAWGGKGYGLEYAHSVGRYSPSEYIRNPRVYWKHQPA